MSRSRRARPSPARDLIVPLALVVVGGYLLLREFVPEAPLERIWPLAVMGLGLVLVVGSFGRGRR